MSKRASFPGRGTIFAWLLNNSTNMTFIGRTRDLAKWAFDRIRNEKFKHNLLQAIPFWVASLLTGLVAVLYTKLFALAEKGTAFIVHWHFWLLFLVTPACFLLAWWVVSRF